MVFIRFGIKKACARGLTYSLGKGAKPFTLTNNLKNKHHGKIYRNKKRIN